MTEDNETEIYNIIFAQSKRSQPNEKRKKKATKEVLSFLVLLTASADSSASLAEFQYLSIFPDCSLKIIPPVSFIISIPASIILIHDLGSSNLDHCNFPVFLVSVPFSSCPFIRTELVLFHDSAAL